jgi:exosortase family protein XrtG
VTFNPILALALVAWAAILWFLRSKRIWIFYYIWGAVGFTLLAILLLRGSWVEFGIEQLTGLTLHHTLGYMGIETRVFDKAPGTILMLIKVDNSWTAIDIDIECSGLLEGCVLMGLMLFYPAYKPRMKAVYSSTGLVMLYLINLVRLYVIVGTIHMGGRDVIYIAHSLIGRLVFFGLTITLYWWLFTRPSLVKVKEYIRNA